MSCSPSERLRARYARASSLAAITRTITAENLEPPAGIASDVADDQPVLGAVVYDADGADYAGEHDLERIPPHGHPELGIDYHRIPWGQRCGWRWATAPRVGVAVLLLAESLTAQ